jgi:proteasome lid subunit RPN8/RPN11
MIRTMDYPAEAVENTLAHLGAAGRLGVECIVLWLGRRTEGGWCVEEAYRPDHFAKLDQFVIPATAMQTLHDRLRQHRLMVVAQVHSHPGRAFHSEADDEGAIVRHAGALSLVLPMFGLKTTRETFLTHAALYRLSDDNRWEDVTVQKDQLCRLR